MKVLVVGLGSIGQRHVRNLRQLLGADVQIGAYRTRGLQRVLDDQMRVVAEGGLNEAYGIETYPTLDDALASGQDAVLVCNPNSLHLGVAYAAAEAGCHLFIEKPLSNDLDGVAKLARLVDERNLAALVGYQLRFHPCLRVVERLLREERIGRVVAARVVDSEYLPGWHPYEDYRESYASRRDLGGGTLLSRVHEMDYLYAFFGLPRRVMTVGGHLSNLEIDVEDVASSLFEFGDTVRGFPVHLHQDVIRRPPKRSCEILGDDGHIEMDLVGSIVRVVDPLGEEAEVHDFGHLPRNQLFLDEMAHFLACMRGEAEPVVSVRDGAQSLAMAVAARESLETGMMVEVQVPLGDDSP